ncbi:hypothetical protein SLA2020_406680 [Shorea laevis]
MGGRGMIAAGDLWFTQRRWQMQISWSCSAGQTEEYGFCNQGVLRIPFEAEDFEERMMMRRSKRKVF